MAGRALALALALGTGAAQDALPNPIWVLDAPHDVLLANGVYSLDADSGCYKKEHMQLWLCTDAHGLWSFQPKEFLHSDQGLMVSTQKHADTPVGAGPWRVWRDGSWVAVSAEVTDEAPPDVVPRVNPEDFTLNQTIAGLLFGLALLGGLLAGLTSSTDEHLRSWGWRLVSAACTFLIAFMIVSGVWDLLTDQFLSAPFPRGLGVHRPIKPGIKIILSFSIFSLCFVLVNALAWKVQYRPSRLMVVKTLFAHITAVFGIVAFSFIQHEASFQVTMHFRGELLHPDVMRALAAFLVVAFAWITFSIYRWASMGLRQEAFRNPPMYPWPAASAPMIAPPAVDRTCIGFGTQPAAAAGGVGGFPPWGHIVSEAEDEAATVVVGFLLSQAIMFCKTGELTGFRRHYTNENSKTMPSFFLAAFICVAVIFIVILSIRTSRSHGGRAGKVLQRSTGMCLAWLLYRAVGWSMRSNLSGNKPLAQAASAIMITIACCIGVVVADKVVAALWSRSVAQVASMGGGVTVEESAMRGVMSCAGLVVALAWQFPFEASVLTLAETETLLARHVTLSTSLISIFLAVVLVLPWRRTILPRSEMREAAHLDDIKYELSAMAAAENYM